MYVLDEIYDAHEKLIALNKGTLEYGFSWKEEDGIILYNPDNCIISYFLPLSLNIILNHITVISCTDAKELKSAAEKLPHALVVLGVSFLGAKKHVSLYYNELMKILPVNLVNRVIQARDLGEFIAVGNEQSKFYDVYRKTYISNETRNKKKIYQAFELFKDSLSQSLFLSILKRYLLQSHTIVPVSDQKQYFEDVYLPIKDEVFVDLGGFTGDTLEAYLTEVNDKFKEFHVFEPSPEMFQTLQQTITSLPDYVQNKVFTYQLGAGHTHAEQIFEEEISGGGSKITSEERIVDRDQVIKIKTAPLDDVLKDVAPTFIKMDIEGYETFALTGARNLIKTHKPLLAICVYHHTFDLWELPLLIHKFVPKGYTYFLRAYTDIWEYVCYCVPEERVSEIWK